MGKLIRQKYFTNPIQILLLQISTFSLAFKIHISVVTCSVRPILFGRESIVDHHVDTQAAKYGHNDQVHGSDAPVTVETVVHPRRER